MVHEWRCPHCGLSAWSDSRGRLSEAAGSHLLEHHSGRISKADFRLRWTCPYCESGGKAHEERTALEEFEHHLCGHAMEAIEANAHMAAPIGHSGNVLVNAPVESAAADNARVHFLAGSDLAIVVTTHPKARIRLLSDRLERWPDRTVVVTTKRRPLDGGLEFDLSSAPLELVELDRRLGPRELGETISRIVDAHHTPAETVSVEFDILSDIVRSFELRRSYDFVTMLSKRLEEVGALTHFYAAERPQLSSAFNVLDGTIDLKLDVESRVFIADR